MKTKRAKGEMGCTALANGRKVTLDPIEAFNLSIPAKEVESLLCCGLRQHWMSATDTVTGKEVFDMGCGAGLGSRWLTFTYKGKSYVIDGEDIAKAFMTHVDSK